jgi:PIN domain-containing protein
VNSELRLRAGVQASAAVKSLRPLIAQGANIVAAAGTPDLHFVQRLQNGYLGWAEDVEHALRAFFLSPWVWEPIYDSARWREIRHLERTSPRPGALVADEVRSQRDRLTDLLDQLEASQVHFELPTGCVAVVPDTNVLVHYKFFKDLDWISQVRTLDPTIKDVRLVLPSVVVDQLDTQSYKSQPHADRAKSVLRAFRQMLEGVGSPEAPTVVRPHVTMQFLVDAPGHEARQNEDDEILTRSEYLAALVGDRVYVTTGDVGMQTRAMTRGMRCLLLPMGFRVGAGDAAS